MPSCDALNLNIAVTYMDPAQLTPNPFNPNVVDEVGLAKLQESITRLGTFKPVIARDLGDNVLEVLAGWHRVVLARRQNEEPGHERLETIPVINLGRIADQRAKEIALADNARYGHDDPYLFMDLISSLEASNSELSSFLPIVFEDLNLTFGEGDLLDVDDDASLQRDPVANVRAPQAPTTHVMFRALLPVQDAHVVTQRIAQTIRQMGLDDEFLIAAGDALVHLFKGIDK